MSPPSQRAFWLRRLHSLSGVLPIGAFLLEHFYTNLSAHSGAERFDGVVRELQLHPLTLPAEILFIGLPLLYHGIYGLLVTSGARFNNGSYGYLRNWLYTLQRISGVLLFFFILYHVANTRLAPLWDRENPLFQIAGEERLVSYAYMRSYLSETHLGLPVLGLYVAGVCAACFHLANGLWNMGIHWGVTIGPAAQRTSGIFCGIFGAGLTAVGLFTLFTFVR